MKSLGFYQNISINTSSVKLRIVFLLIFINYTVCLDFPSTVLEEDSVLLDFKDNDDIKLYCNHKENIFRIKATKYCYIRTRNIFKYSLF